MSSLRHAAILSVLALALLGGAAHAQCFGYPNLITNGDFENGSTGWTRTQGSFSTGTDPSDSNNQVGFLRGASGFTSEVVQSFAPTTSGWHAVLLYMNGYATCRVTATVIVGSQTYSGTDEVQYGGLTYTFQVASGVTSGTLKISVTCPTFLGQYIRIDNVCLSQI